jgi:hypothetical protein
MATTLNALITDKTTDKTALAIKVDDGEAAKGDLAEVLGELATLAEVQAIRDAALARASLLVAGSQAAVAPFQTAPAYTGAAAAIDAAVIAAGKTESGMTGVVGAALPMGGTYATHYGAAGTAATTLATDTTDEALKRIDLAAKRARIDVRITALTTYAVGVESRFARAKALLATAGMAAQTQSVAAAWWALHHVKALLAEVTAASSTTLVTAVGTACDDYATAFDVWVTAREKLETSTAAAVAAAAKAAQADGQALAALATFIG